MLTLDRLLFYLVDLEELNLSKVEMSGALSKGAGLSTNILGLKRLKFLNLSNNRLKGPIVDEEGWADFTQLEMIELQNNRFTGEIPRNWAYLTELTYVNLSNNTFTGTIPVLRGAQKLEGIDFGSNTLADDFPWAYFAEDSFQKLEFINVNFNPKVKVPESCIRFAYCYKRTLMTTGDGNQIHRLYKDH